MPSYTTIEEIENYLKEEIESGQEEQVEKWIEAMSDYIEKKTGRVFTKSETEERLFDGVGLRELVIDDLLEIEKIEVSDAEMDLDDYYLYPANDLPKTLIKGSFPEGEQNIKITGKWGYSEEVPENIKFACSVLVAGILQHSISHEGEIQSERVGDWQISYKSDAQWQDFKKIDDVLDEYKRY